MGPGYHAHDHDWLIEPFAGPLMQRAMLEVLCSSWPAVRPLGWAGSCCTATSYDTESMSHGMLPGLVVAALRESSSCSAAPPAWCSRRRDRAIARDERSGTDAAWPSACPRCSGSARCSRCRPARRRACRSCSGDILGVTAADLAAGSRARHRGLGALGVGRAAPCHGRLRARVGWVAGRVAGALGASPCSSCWR